MSNLKLQQIQGNTWLYVDPLHLATRFSVKSQQAAKSVDGMKLTNATALFVYNTVNPVVRGDEVANDPISVRISTSGATASDAAILAAFEDAVVLARIAILAKVHAGLTPGFETVFATA